MSPGDGEPTGGREAVHSRLIDAPVARVFGALADPVRLARWWGPQGFTSTFETFELQAGGHWRFVMHGPDGADYPNDNIFREVEAPGRVVVEHLAQDHHFVLTITFDAQGGQTRVGWRQVFDTAQHKRSVEHVVSRANEENLDRLAEEVRRRLVEIRSYKLKAGMAGDFHSAVKARAVPMLQRWGTDVVAFGPSAHEQDTYFLIRAYDDLADLRARQDAFYGSPEWRTGPREDIVPRIENYLSTVVWLGPEAVEDLRRTQAIPGV